MRKKVCLYLIVTIFTMVVVFVQLVTVTQAGSLKGVTINVIGDDDRLRSEVISLLPEFTKKTGIKVNATPLPYTATHEKMITELVGQTGAYDVYLIDACWLAEFAEAGFLKSLDDFVEELKRDLSYDFGDLTQAGIEYGQCKGTTYGIPIVYLICPLMVYRADVFDEAGFIPPRSWNEFTEQARSLKGFLTIEGATIKYGTATVAERDDPLVMEWMYRHLRMGGYIDSMGRGGLWNEGFHPVLNNNLSKRTARLYVEHSTADYVAPGALSLTWDEVLTLMMTGKVVMINMWSARTPELMDPEQCKYSDVIKFAEMPGKGPNPQVIIASAQALIPTTGVKGKRLEAAKEFIKWLSSKEVDKRIAMTALGKPIRNSVSKDPEVLANNPALRALTASLEGGIPEPMIPEWTEVKYWIAEYLSKAILGEMDVSTAMEKTSVAITSLFKKAGYYK